MKIRLLPFSRDLRSPEQRKQYETIEQQRADAWLSIALARKHACILRGQLNVSLLKRQAE